MADPKKLKTSLSGSGIRSAFNSLRGDLAATFNPESESPDLHRSTSRALVEKGNRFGLTPTASAILADVLGIANEGVAGALAPTLDKPQPVFSHGGFDVDDIAENRVGQDEALAQPPRRFGLGIPLTSPQLDRAILSGLRAFVGKRSKKPASLGAALLSASKSRVR